MRTHLFDSPKARRVAAGVATPVVALGLYVELGRKASPAMLDHFGYSHQQTAGTATVAALYVTEGGYTSAPPNGPVNPSYTRGAIADRPGF
jgi:hypothetical protein